MMADEAKPESPTEGMAYVRAPDHRFIYSNAHRIRVTASDVQIVISVLTDMPAQGKPLFVVREEATVAMTYAQLKLMTLELQELLDEYEKISGPIEIIKPLREQLTKVRQIVRNVHGEPKAEEKSLS